MRLLSFSLLLVGCLGPVIEPDAGQLGAGGGGAVAGGGGPVGGGGGQAGGGGGSGGGSAARGFCPPCVSSADCAPGALCLGGINPRCGQDCGATGTCPGAVTCDSINGGKIILARNCAPSDAACGTHTAGEGLDCGDTWDNYGNAMLVNTCVGACHRHDLAWTTLADVRAQADGIRLSVERGNMPQGQTLSAADRLRLLTWLACGAP